MSADGGPAGGPAPLISVALPVRNNAGTIGLAVRSILAQTERDFELLLLDDGSTDGTLELLHGFAAEDHRVRVLSDGTGRGLPARLNIGIDAARGELFARMDGDDVSYPDRFARQVARLREADAPDLVGAGVAVFRDGFELVGVRRPAPDHATIAGSSATGFGLAHPTWMGRTAFFRRWRYRVGAHGMEDQDLLLRAHREARYANVPEILLGYREPSLRLGKILRARRHMVVGYGREHLRQGSPRLAAQAVAGQAVRAAFDVAAIGLKLDYRLLRHRAQPATPGDAAAWRAVLAGLGETPAASPDGEPRR